MFWQYALITVAGYLIGGINFATIFAAINKKNIRDLGSGNPGTMNMMRNLGAKWGALTFVCDALKGTVSALIGLAVLSNAIGMYAGGLSAVIGHIYPVYSGFKGGKGVATAIGVFFATSPWWSLATFILILVVIITTKYGSLGSLTFVTILTVQQGGEHMGELAISLMLFVIWGLVWYGHRKNLVQLVAGTERKSHILKTLKRIKDPKQKKSDKQEDKDE